MAVSPGFIFGGEGMPKTPQELARMRAIAEALAGNRKPAHNIGEGLADIGNAIAYRMMMAKAGKAEAAGQASAAQSMQGIFPDFPAAPAAPADPKGGIVAPVGPDPASPAGGARAASEIQQSAPENWEQIRNGIFAGESGGDYDALFGFSNRAGKQFANTKLTDMTVDQALAFANPSGPYAQFVKGQVGRVATPMGAYQVVGSTLGAAKKGLGLSGEEVMTPQLQDRIGQWILANQGTGAWAGYKGPRATAPAVAAIERVAPTQVASLDPSIGFTPVQAAPSTPPAVGQPMATSEAGGRVVRALLNPEPMGGGQGMMPQPQAAQIAQAVQPQAVPPMAVPPMAGGPAPARSGPTVQELLKAAQNPWLNDGQRAVVGALLKQRMEQDDPKRQLEMQNMQLEQEKMRLEIELARNPQMSPYERAQIEQRQRELQAQQNKLLEVSPGTTIFDPQKREPIYTAPAKADVPSAVQEYQFAVSQGFPGSFQDWEASKKGGMSFQTNPDGTVTFQQGANIKPLTEGQSKDTVFATRAEGSLPLIDKYGDALTSLGESVGGQTPVVGNYLKSPEFQQAEQAGKEFLQAILRKDTGAAITPAETNEYGSVYLPRPGDSPQVLAQKKASRVRALEALKAGMPPQAILQQEKALANTNKAQTPPSDGPAQPKTDDEYNALPSGALFIDPDDGKTYRKP